MRTRNQLVTRILREHEAVAGGPDAYSVIIKAELDKRLTRNSYLTCEDFDHFDVNCCTSCHSESQYDLTDVVLNDGRHAWVCCTIRNLLIRRTRKPPSSDPEREEAMKLLAKAFGQKPDPIGDQVHAANMGASSDEEKLYYCLRYAHHSSGRKRGHKKLETLVHRALRLPGRGPAISCNESNPPKSCGLCLLCGALLYEENMIPGTQHHNCRQGRELMSRKPDLEADEDACLCCASITEDM